MKHFSLLRLALAAPLLAGCSALPDQETAAPNRPNPEVTTASGEVKDGHLYGQPIQYLRTADGRSIFQGDILLAPDQLRAGNGAQTEGTGRTQARWPNNTVYFTIDPALPNQQRVWDAVAHWQQRSQLRFVQGTGDGNYIKVVPGSGCSSFVGRIGGQQTLDLAPECTTGNTIHEFGHAIGLWHEQSRSDRDDAITVRFENIQDGAAYNFQTFAQQGFDGFNWGPFDFGSIMMYGPYFFSKNGQPTITRKDGSVFNVQRDALSFGDVDVANAMYSVNWANIPGKALDVAVGANGSVFVVGDGATPGGHPVFRRDGTGWTQIAGGVEHVAVTPQGRLWAVNSFDDIFEGDGNGNWNLIPGKAKDVTVGANGSVFVLGNGFIPGGHPIFRRDGNSWTLIPGGLVRIAATPQGRLWGVNSYNNIFEGDGNGNWSSVPGAATDVAVGADGTVYVAGTEGVPGGYPPFRYYQGNWVKLTGGVTSVAATPQGRLWVTNSFNSIFQAQ